MAAEDRFSTYLLSLDDESFSVLYRNYRGPIETPYNKHDVVADLRDFVGRQDTQERIVSLLSEDDVVLLAAVDTLDRPDDAALAQFLDGEWSYSLLQEHILNAIDRLLLITNAPQRSWPGRLEINPILRDRLRQAGVGPSVLLSGRPIPPEAAMTPTAGPWFTTLLACSALSFTLEQPDLFTRTGALRKRAASAIEARFGQLFLDEHGAARQRLLWNALEVLGLVRRTDSSVQPVLDAWEEFAELPERWIQALLWGAAVSERVDEAAAAAELILAAIAGFDADQEFELGAVLRVLYLSAPESTRNVSRETVLRLVDLGVLLVRDEWFRLNPAARAAVPEPGKANESAAQRPRVLPNLEVSLLPGMRFSDALVVAAMSELRNHDLAVQLEITNAAVSRARKAGLGDVAARLAAVAGELPQNVDFVLKRWSDRAGAIRLRRGLILSTDEQSAEILEHSSDFRDLVADRLSNTIFLMVDEPRRIERTLGRLELGGSVEVEGGANGHADTPDYAQLVQNHSQRVLFGGVARSAIPGSPTQSALTNLPPSPLPDRGSPVRESILAELRDQLAAQTLSEDQHQQLLFRINQGLVLFPAQLRPGVAPQFGVEAHGLDYLGKIRLIEQAIASGDRLEVVMRARDGAPQRVLVRPKDVSEHGGDLMLRARQEPEGQAIRIRIRRISLVRRLSGALIRRPPRRS